jgi:energy-coupling factor transport system permease protein
MAPMLDPRSKLLLALAYATLIALTRRPAWLLAEWMLLVAATIVMGQFKTYLRWLAMLVPMALFFGAVSWWSFDRATGQAAAMGLLAITTVFFVFFASTAPEDLGNSLVHAGLPYPVAFVLTAAMQFAPVLGRRARAVVEAQQARGIVLQPGWRALRNYPALLLPLLIQSFQMAESLAEAMEARGFGRSGRTFRHVYRMGLLDWLVILAGWAITFVMLRYFTR